MVKIVKPGFFKLKKFLPTAWIFKNYGADWQNLAKTVSKSTGKKLALWSKWALFCKVMIVRGIGYRVFILNNNYISSELNKLNTGVLKFARQTCSINLSELSSEPEENNILTSWVGSFSEFFYSRYLVVRAGHTKDKFLPLSPKIQLHTLKKDRKLVIYGSYKQEVNALAFNVYNYRQPSVYTGRGIRRKHEKPVRKLGKREKK